MTDTTYIFTEWLNYNFNKWIYYIYKLVICNINATCYFMYNLFYVIDFLLYNIYYVLYNSYHVIITFVIIAGVINMISMTKSKKNTNIKTTQRENLSEYMNEIYEKRNNKKYFSNLDNRMKEYQAYTERNIYEIDQFTGYIIRLNGRSFSKLLNELKNNEFSEIRTPFINDFKLAMDRTTSDLLKEFNASTGYNHSDEISLYFKPLNDNPDDEMNKNHQFNGNVNKLLSLTASFASVRLVHHLRTINSDKFSKIFDRVTFNSNVIIFPNDNEICNYFMWRSYDCFRDFVLELCNTHFSGESLNNMDVNQRIDKLKNERNFDVNDFNSFLRNGTFIKRELVTQQNENKETMWYNQYIRFALPNLECNQDYIDLFKCKNFQEWEYQNIVFELLNNFT